MKLTNQPSIKAAWQGYLATVLSPESPVFLQTEIELAFYAGAAVLFYAIMAALDAGDEPTEDDLKRMDNLHKEVEAFAEGFDAEVLRRKLASPGL